MATKKDLSKEVARRYQKVSRKEKKKILGEFCQATGYNRHYAASILYNWGRWVYWHSPTGEQTLVIVGERRVQAKVTNLADAIGRVLLTESGARLVSFQTTPHQITGSRLSELLQKQYVIEVGKRHEFIDELGTI